MLAALGGENLGADAHRIQFLEEEFAGVRDLDLGQIGVVRGRDRVHRIGGR